MVNMKSGYKKLVQAVWIVLAVILVLCLLAAAAVTAKGAWNNHEIKEEKRTISIEPDVKKSLDAYVSLLEATLENNQTVMSEYSQRERDVAMDCEDGYLQADGMPDMNHVKITVQVHYIQHENGRVTLGVSTGTEILANKASCLSGSGWEDDGCDVSSWSDDHVLTFTTASMAGLEGKAKAPYVIRDDETLFGPDEPGYKPLKDLRKWDKR
ncbi:hypothetical protein OZX57_05290 [Bifidobacterium sp. ESL0682]|uniref:hypothetical protein n=1 Tax=Bifidobacterium sp. ESL0682 TaxID=2983212 RepID=UPI0023F668A0|nr:hypothetical protein [Bifidobacterium sp. ESL0682]WEV41453.1 hypothetical protein OZX57_05290 [Bifidobacterium sp. ESL0682]